MSGMREEVDSGVLQLRVVLDKLAFYLNKIEEGANAIGDETVARKGIEAMKRFITETGMLFLASYTGLLQATGMPMQEQEKSLNDTFILLRNHALELLRKRK